MLKLAIIVGLAVLGGMIFYTEIDTLFPNTASTVPASLHADIDALGNQTNDFVSERLAESTVHLEKMANDTVSDINNRVQTVQGQVINGTSALNPFVPVTDEMTNDTGSASDNDTDTDTGR